MALITTILLPAMPAVAADPVVVGSYLEVPIPRDPATGYRERHRTLVAWHVDEGEWNEEVLDGLEIVAVLESEGPLHAPTVGKVRAKRVLIDRRASAAQEKALLAMVVALAPDHLETIESVETAELEGQRETTGKAQDGSPTASAVRRDEDVERHRWTLEVGRAIKIELEVAESPDGCSAICGADARPIPSVSEGVHVHDARPRSFRYNGVEIRAEEIDRSGRPLAGVFSL